MRSPLFLAAALASLLLLVLPSASLAAAPLESCQGKKLKAVGAYLGKVGNCFGKAAKQQADFSPGALEEALASCRVSQFAKLESGFAKAETKASAKGADCGGASTADVAAAGQVALDRVLHLALAGVDTPTDEASLRAAHKLLASLLKTSAAYSKKWLGAEQKRLKKGDPAPRNASRAKALGRYESGWSRAGSKATSSGVAFDFGTPGTAVAGDLQIVVNLVLARERPLPGKRDDVLALPPIFVNPLFPHGGSSVRVGADVAGATAIDFSVSGGGCGTLVGGSAAADFFFEDGDVGEFGLCTLTADVTTPAGPVVLERTFSVLPAALVLPDIQLLGGYFTAGPLPEPSGGPEIAFVDAPGTLITGGTARLRIQLQNPALAEQVKTVNVQIGDVAAGHYVAPAFVAGDEVLIEIALTQELAAALEGALTPRGNPLRQVLVSISDLAGRAGTALAVAFGVRQVGTGDVQVGLSWNTPTDLDLHVVDPFSEEIYFGNSSSASGGRLDLDSNAGCSIDGINNENVTWDAGTAPPGPYQVRVNFWSDCQEAGATWTATANFCGESKTLGGSFAQGTSTGGGLGSGAEVLTFDVDCAFRVRGVARYEDFAISESGLAEFPHPMPIRLAKVEIRRVSDDLLLGEGVTRQDGTFDVRFSNTGAPGYRVWVKTENDVAPANQVVRNSQGAIYALESDPIDESAEPDKEGLELLADEIEAGPAFNIFDVGVEGAAFTRGAFGRDMPRVGWLWINGSLGNCGGDDVSCYHAPTSEISVLSTFEDPDEYDDLVLLHELGHHWQTHFSGDDSPGGPHSSRERVTPTLAWGEGSATYFACRARNTAVYIDTKGDGSDVAVFSDIEYLDPLTPLGTSNDIDTGNVSEDIVSAVLWDLADASDDGNDTVARAGATDRALGYLKRDTFVDRGVPGADLVDFLDGWFCNGFGDRGGFDTGVQGILGKHDFFYDFEGPADCP